jgi:Zn-dependent protease with chaperone function
VNALADALIRGVDPVALAADRFSVQLHRSPDPMLKAVERFDRSQPWHVRPGLSRLFFGTHGTLEERRTWISAAVTASVPASGKRT